MEEASKRNIPTKEEWAEITSRLSDVFGSVHLMADGYRLTIERCRVKKNTLSNVIYIDGTRRGADWCLHFSDDQKFEITEIAKRFLRRRSRRLYSEKQMKNYRKIFSKRDCEKMSNRCQIYYDHFWPSAFSLKAHLIKNNQYIEFFPDGFPKSEAGQEED